MKKTFLSLWAFCVTGCIALAILSLPARAAGGGPVDMLQSVADQMIASLKANKTTLKQNPGLVYSLATRIIVPHADLDEMSKRVLPPQTWNSASASQRQAFKREFTTLLVRTYASALAEYKDQTVRFFPVRGGYAGRSTVRVDSQIIRSDGPSISVNYSVVSTGSGWRLYDMTVEGVSMLQSFRSQFSDQLARGDMASLINVLKQHNGR
ncbi:MAG TPA: ABC transporter substrate-binding protein [Gammaproteobacteria bacterium]|nr:ABC transporter substrate-binding protein [Gammaproteobacteria bacterium]